ncbi:MAG: methyltransferase domain-containing protein, partial [Rubrivivax sp.]
MASPTAAPVPTATAVAPEARVASQAHGAVAQPSAWVLRWQHLLAPGARVLDLACGSGRDVYLLSQLVGADGVVMGVDMTAE